MAAMTHEEAYKIAMAAGADAATKSACNNSDGRRTAHDEQIGLATFHKIMTALNHSHEVYCVSCGKL